jgi:arylsulfatase A-like enzyme
MTGQYPLTHGVFVNDVPITGDPVYLAEVFKDAGYDTAYIGKWHIDGHGRSAYIPPERRKGFDYWKARECTHDYNHSFYYADGPEKLWWDGYDAAAQTQAAQAYIRRYARSPSSEGVMARAAQTRDAQAYIRRYARPPSSEGVTARAAQTRDAQAYIRRYARPPSSEGVTARGAQTQAAQAYTEGHDPATPFLLMLSWGPPHAPYATAPERFRALYDPADIQLCPNVPEEMAADARAWLAGYYAHCSALDAYFGELMRTLDEAGLAEDTLVVFTADHGDMLGSHGAQKKQRPWDESIRVPLLLRYPAAWGREGREIATPFNSPHLMPTLLGLAGLPVPTTVEGRDFAPFLRGEAAAPETAALIELPACFHQYAYDSGGRDWRGLRTARYTYVIHRDGPWMLYDNVRDPYQLENRVGHPDVAAVQAELDAELRRRLAARGDDITPGPELIRAAGYPVDERGDPVYEP